MTDEKPPSRQPQQKRWIDKISQLLTGEPQDQDDLLEILRDSEEKRLLRPDALSMIEGVLRMSEMRARDVMIPRVQMVVVPKGADLKDIFPLVLESAHSRFPVIEDDPSMVIGILLAKDLLAHMQKDEGIKVGDIMRPVSVIPESKRLNVQLKEFRTKRNHMAIVVDEYGKAAGLVTIEDVLELIVGEIEDEHDDQPEEVNIIKRKDNEFIIKALTPIEEFDAYFGIQFAADEYDTVGGFIVNKLEHLPKKGEKVVIEKYRFEVMSADRRRVHLLKLKLLK